ncbi:alkaline phosphatase D family protein [Segniliparus rotundus]|uniref:alkaline phosphatase D family protein n=1 Tax=Segniliparus rotundus TaxID=286802 RepID=UPI00059E8D49|nr:alkaline phosphatase D family protein [Segniliparus rotundus]
MRRLEPLPRFGRRSALLGALGAAVLLGTGRLSARSSSAAGSDLFALGVASGDPLPDGVVLWTRLAPAPLAGDGFGGMGAAPVTVQWQVASDEKFAHIVREGSVTATRELAHSAHPEVHGLEPDRVYYYRFKAGRELSPVGRTRTAPAPGAHRDQVRFAFASCQRWDQGYYTAYDHMAEEDLDLVAHLGDYIYEYPFTSEDNLRGEQVPDVFSARPTGLPRYRTQYALSKLDEPLRRAHASFPWVVVFDDHEVENDWAGWHSGSEYHTPRAQFLAQRAAAFQARYEHQPLRVSARPHGASTQDYRRLGYGRLADFFALDTRQYRDPQPCSGVFGSDCPERTAPNRVMMGDRERAWLLDGLASSRAVWKVALNQVQIMQTRLRLPKSADAATGERGIGYNVDCWDGYPAERAKLLGGAARRGIENLVVVTGDTHKNYAGDLKPDFDDPASPVVAAEFVGTSISSGGDGKDVREQEAQMKADNPHLKFFNDQRGYVTCELTPERCRTDYRVLDYVQRPGSPIATLRSFVVESGRPGILDA